MAVDTFYPGTINPQATNWSVANRFVGAFAPCEQSPPIMKITIMSGFLLSGTTLTEVAAQSTAAITAPSTATRIDRVVIDRSTGAVSVVSGTEGSGSPPAIPTGKLPIARVVTPVGALAVTNAMIFDERALWDLTPTTSSGVMCRVSRNNVDQTGVANDTWTKVNLTTAEINIGSAFDTVNYRFQPTIAGNYIVRAQASMPLTANTYLWVATYKNGAYTSVNRTAASTAVTYYADVSDMVSLNGTTDYVEMYIKQQTGATATLKGHPADTFFYANLLG